MAREINFEIATRRELHGCDQIRARAARRDFIQRRHSSRCFWEVRGEDYGCAWERKTGTLLRLLIRGLKGGWTQPRNVPVLLGAAFLLVKVVGGEDDGLG